MALFIHGLRICEFNLWQIRICRIPWISCIWSKQYISGPVNVSFPGGTSGGEPACNADDIRDTGSTPGSGGSPGGGHGDPLQCSCLEGPMERGAWWATVHGVAKSRSVVQHSAWWDVAFLFVQPHLIPYARTHPLLNGLGAIFL